MAVSICNGRPVEFRRRNKAGLYEVPYGDDFAHLLCRVA